MMLDHTLQNLCSTCWAFSPQALFALLASFAHSGENLQIQQVITPDANDQMFNTCQPWGFDGIAVVPVWGILHRQASAIGWISYFGINTAVEDLEDALARCVASESVNAIVLDVQSGGGTVDGIADVSDQIHDACTIKPVIAHIDDAGTSAAYWIASQANTIYANETAAVGSIGVYTVVMDQSRWFEEELLTKVHRIAAGEFKGAGTPGTQITDDQLEAFQGRVNAVAEVFINHIARGLKISKRDARRLADGRVHTGQHARNAGLVDGIQSFDDTLDMAIREWGNASRQRRPLEAGAQF